MSLQIQDLQGRVIESLVDNQFMETGTHQLEWKATNLVAGTYFLRLKTKDTMVSKYLTKIIRHIL